MNGEGVFIQTKAYLKTGYIILNLFYQIKKSVTQHFEQCEETLMSHRYNYMALDI